MKAVRGAEIGSDHYLVLMKIKLMMERRVRGRDKRVKQQIKINRLKDANFRRKYQVMMNHLIHPFHILYYMFRV